MESQIINIELIEPESTTLTVKKVANDLNNQASFILVNSQVILDIWKDTLKILQRFQKNNPDNNILLNGLSLEDVKTIVPKMLDANIIGSGRVSEIANLIKLTNSYKDHFNKAD